MISAIRAFAATSAVAISGVAAIAHPGHGNPQHPDGILHVLTSPTHFLSWTLGAGVLGFVLMVCVRLVRRRQAQRSVAASRRSHS